MLPRIIFDRGAMFGDEHGDADGNGITLYWGPFILTLAFYRRTS